MSQQTVRNSRPAKRGRYRVCGVALTRNDRSSDLASYVPELRVRADECRLRLLLHDFGLVWQGTPSDERAALVAVEPDGIDDRWDAFCAAYAEHLCTEDGLTPPEWTHATHRRLSPYWFAGGCFAFDRSRTISMTPPALGAHGIWFPRDELAVI